MATVVLFDPEAAIPQQVRWAAWFARSQREALTMLLPDFEGRAGDAGKAKGRAVIAADDAFEFVDDGEQVDDTVGDSEHKLRCRIELVDPADAPGVLAACSKALPNLLVVLRQQLDAKDELARTIGSEILPKISCSVAIVRLGAGEGWPPQHLLVPASRGAHPRAALQLAQQLATVVDGKLTGAYVEPDIGSDAQGVGRHVIDKVIGAALDSSLANKVARRVVVTANIEAGLLAAIEHARPDVVVVGMPRPGMLSPQFHGTLPARLARRSADVPFVMLRQALPLGNRMRRGIEDMLRRFVPQVERETRVELAARVQSSSAWDFDFVALMSLSTIIAALGLLLDSAAVIIGAMLIAPLMTPVLGIGLALAQGNALLARLAFRAIGFGVGTALLLAFVVGSIDRSTHVSTTATQEMLARGWPGLIDLLIAFVSGLAAAYAHSRPGLIAALPGVAIAAALVPPIATAGLALAAADFELAYGAFLLFFSNMVAIVLAAGFSLWVVGVRKQRDDGWLRHVGNGLIVVVLVLAVYLTQRTHRGGAVALSDAVRPAIVAALPEGLRLAGLVATQGHDHVDVTATLGGASVPPAALAERLLLLVDPLVDGPVSVRVAYVWEVFASRGESTGGK